MSKLSFDPGLQIWLNFLLYALVFSLCWDSYGKMSNHVCCLDWAIATLFTFVYCSVSQVCNILLSGKSMLKKIGVPFCSTTLLAYFQKKKNTFSLATIWIIKCSISSIRWWHVCHMVFLSAAIWKLQELLFCFGTLFFFFVNYKIL